MPRYRFNVIDGHKLFDPTGRDLPNEAAAHQEAKNIAGELRKSPLNNRWEAIEVVDESGRRVHKEAVQKRDDGKV